MFSMDEFLERMWEKMPHVFYNPEKNEIVVAKFQRWVPGDRTMVSVHNKERCTREDIFLKTHIYIGDMDYK